MDDPLAGLAEKLSGPRSSKVSGHEATRPARALKSLGSVLDKETRAIMNFEASVKRRYSAAAQASELALCCPVEYDRRYIDGIPAEVIEKDYGCGNPSAYIAPGETVLDLGSGAGKICFIAAQVVGPKGRVIGVDMTDEMLAVARRSAPIVGERLGYLNVEFRKGADPGSGA